MSFGAAGAALAISSSTADTDAGGNSQVPSAVSGLSTVFISSALFESKQLDGRIRGDLEHPPAADRVSCHLERGLHGHRAARVRDVEKHGIPTPAGDDVQSIRDGQPSPLAADVMPVELHDASHRLK